jgi:hypothetical protein
MIRNRPSPALHRLLDKTLRFAPEYNDGFSNHLPMALAALEGIGAEESRLEAFFDSYARRLVSRPLKVAGTSVSDWSILRGRFDAFETLRSTFAVALQHEGRDAVLSGALPLLFPGIAAAAFHGVIRVAHAVESRHDPELAAALAYWSARWMSLPPPASVEPDTDNVSEWLDAIDRRLLRDDAGWTPKASQIDERMREAVQTTAYRLEAGRLRMSGRDAGAQLIELALAAAARYSRTRSFIVLHIATAARAARTLVPWLPREGAALAPLWHAAAAASLAAETARALSVEMWTGIGLDWAEVLALARASDDEHVVKLVHAMNTQNTAAPHPDWLRAAVVAVSP